MKNTTRTNQPAPEPEPACAPGVGASEATIPSAPGAEAGARSGAGVQGRK